MSEEHKEMKAWIRPLSMPSLGELPFVEHNNQPIDPSELLKDLSRDWSGDFLQKIRKRYDQITTTALDIVAVPAEEQILNKLIWPLMEAKQNFILGHYLGCISLCGMVCEMGAIFIFDLVKISLEDNILHPKHHHKIEKVSVGDMILDFKQAKLIEINGRKLKPGHSEYFFSERFEKEGQECRIRILREYGFLDERLAKDIDSVRKVRREYLHFLSKDYSRIEADATSTYEASFRFVKSIVHLPIGQEGSVVVPEHLRRYLKRKDSDK